MFEFSVKCNNLIDWHAEQIAFDTLRSDYLATPNSNLQRYALCGPLFRQAFITHTDTQTLSWNNPVGDMHATQTKSIHSSLLLSGC